jgi:hypothetical protein
MRCVRAPCDAYERTVYSTVCRVPRQVPCAVCRAILVHVRIVVWLEPRCTIVFVLSPVRCVRVDQLRATRRPATCDASTSYVRRVGQVGATRRPATCDASTSYVRRVDQLCMRRWTQSSTRKFVAAAARAPLCYPAAASGSRLGDADGAVPRVRGATVPSS